MNWEEMGEAEDRWREEEERDSWAGRRGVELGKPQVSPDPFFSLLTWEQLPSPPQPYEEGGNFRLEEESPAELLPQTRESGYHPSVPSRPREFHHHPLRP